MDEYYRCKNSLTGEHKWLERRGKNKDKPEQCVLCNFLKVDLIIASSTRKQNENH